MGVAAAPPYPGKLNVLFGYPDGLLSEFGFRLSTFGVIVPVTNRSKCSSNALVVIQVTATQGEATDSDSQLRLTA